MIKMMAMTKTVAIPIFRGVSGQRIGGGMFFVDVAYIKIFFMR